MQAAGDDADGCYEMSVGNPDKGLMDIEEVIRRVTPFQDSGTPLVVVQVCPSSPLPQFLSIAATASVPCVSLTPSYQEMLGLCSIKLVLDVDKGQPLSRCKATIPLLAIFPFGQMFGPASL